MLLFIIEKRIRNDDELVSQGITTFEQLKYAADNGNFYASEVYNQIISEYERAMKESEENDKGILDTIKSIFNALNPFSEDFFAYKLIELLIEALKNLFEFLFVPSEDRLIAITNTVSSKFGFIDSIKEAINSLQNILTNIGNVPTLSVNVDSKYYEGDLTYIDLSWYAPFKPYGDLVITGFVYLFFLWRLFVHAPGIIQGSSGSIISINDNSDEWGNDL